MKNALILVDLQYDFMPGGALAVRSGDQVVSIANQLVPFFDRVFATQDWHPSGHLSFASQHDNAQVGDVVTLAGTQQVLWPDHCIQGSPGAQLHLDLDLHQIDSVIQKGTDPQIDSYSGFFDNGHRRSTGLDQQLKGFGIDRLVVMGLATDYCVKFTVLDAIELGYQVSLFTDGCRGVDLNPGDVDSALEQMNAAGVEIVTSQHWIKKSSSSS